MRYATIVLAGVVLGCASAGTAGDKSSAPRANRSVLTLEEISKTGSNDAFTAVQSLRPHWLRTRGASSINLRESIKVYLDGNLMGGVEYLRQIPTNSISTVRHMDGLEATQRYGLDHGHGAILVFTRRETGH